MKNEEMIGKMKVEINGWISHLKIEYEKHGRSEWYQRSYDRICGMIKMLSIATGNEYYFDEKGLHERFTV